ncbi:Pet127-domain-containing protein [Lophium mytilinum]|uniref:Pet127-domain-containing protein n=1 Tax=Lophium mytilinum TaxID=390894 RepID=A0A6A6QE17_9PEZI|nr:Pet127-domain-containing protein [Lophium mytilinum]
MSADELHFTPVDVEVPPVPTLAHGLDRVLFNPGVYHLQDPRSRVYNFDPYLEKIMPATEFDFDSLEKYMTSSKDQGLINMAKTLDAKFTGSTSSMSGVLTHFHYLLSQWRKLNLSMLSKEFPELTDKFSKIQRSPTAIFLRWKDGTYAIDADKEFDTPNIMSWLGQSMEKLLTNSPDKFERYRRSNPEETPADDDGKCFHYTQQGKVLMRSQLDAKDPRLPGTGIFDLKTRAVVSVRMEASEFQHRSGYQIRNLRGEWESFEREYFDMIRATMLKYSLQVRMGRMDGIFIAFHNVERIFGFQYVSKAEMDLALHGQEEACLGDQEFKLSVELLSEILEKATKKFPKQSIRLHFETRDVQVPFMYVFAEPVSEEQVEAIQNKNQKIIKEFEKSVVGIAEVEDEEAPVTQPVEDVEAEEDPITDDIAETEEKVDPLANAASIVESLDASLPEPAEDTVLGLTLTVRNKVNGNYVSRPTNLSPAEEWAIEYSLSEIPAENGRAVRLLQSLKARRQKALIREAVDENANNYYSKILQDFSNKGRAWRTKMDERDAEQEKLVYTPLGMDKENVVAQMGPWLRNDEGKQDSTVPEEPEVKVENPEEYMEWLYSNMGNVKNGGA